MIDFGIDKLALIGAVLVILVAAPTNRRDLS